MTDETLAEAFGIRKFLIDNFSTGDVQVELIEPNVRLTFHASHEGDDGNVLVPVVPVIIPMKSLLRLAQQLAAAHALANRRFVS